MIDLFVNLPVFFLGVAISVTVGSAGWWLISHLSFSPRDGNRNSPAE